MSVANIMDEDIMDDLRQFDTFQGISDKTLKKYLPYVYFRTYKKNQCLFMQGDPRDRIFFLLDGYIMYERNSKEGSMMYLDFVKKKQMFPYVGLFQDPVYQDTAIAVTDVDLYFIQTQILEEQLKTNPKQLLSIIYKLSDILNLHQKRVQKIMVSNAQDRVLNALEFLMRDLGIKNEDGIMIPCPLTTTNIAKISGTTRETVSLLMNQLKREHVIIVNSKKIHFLKPEYFKERLSRAH